MTLMPQPGAPLHAGETVESHQYRYMMGTSIEVQAFGGDEATRRSAIDEAFAAFAEIDRLMSNYRDDSELAAVNRNAARESVPVSEPMFAVLDAARRVSAASSGAFDITVGPLVRLWGFHDKTPHIPSDAELASVRPLVGYREEQARLDRLMEQARQSARSADLARIRYREGLTDFLDLLDAERTQLSAESAVAQVEAGVFVSVVDVYKALGGASVP